MRLVLAALAVILFCGCASSCASTEPDPDPDPFGQPCANNGIAFPGTCRAGDAFGWCIAQGRDDGICRRACGIRDSSCPDGGTPTAGIFPGYCYCVPVT